MSTAMRTTLVLCVVLCSIAAWAFEVPLTYQRSAKESTGPSFGIGNLKETYEPPAGDWKLPAFTSKKPAYVLAKLGDQERLFVFDQQKPEDSFYNRLYFDANGNKDLNDDPVIDGTIEKESHFTSTRFPPIDMTIPVDGKALPYSAIPSVMRFEPGFVLRWLSSALGGGSDTPEFGLQPNCDYTGDFDLEGKRYTVRLEDANANGRFDDRLTIENGRFRTESDGVQMRGDHFVVGGAGEAGPFVYQCLGNTLVVDASVFDVAFDFAAGKMTLTPYAGDTAPVKLPGQFETLTLYTDKPKATSIMMYRPAPAVSLPCGTYRLAQYDLMRKDDKGQTWIVNAVGTSASAELAATKGQETTASFGEPFSATVTSKLSRGFFGGTSAELSFTAYGQGKERIGEPRPVTGDLSRSDLAAPTFKAAKADGEIVAQVTFRYG